jgi:hypothetical protein
VLSPDPDAVLARLRAICLALPESEETVSHGIPAFRGRAGCSPISGTITMATG